MDERKVLVNRMSALKDCWPWETWSWGAFMEAIGIDRSSNWEDTVDRVCRLIGGDPEREAAAAWVEAQGGLDEVKHNYSFMTEQVAERVGVERKPDEPAHFTIGRIIGELDKRLMPEGMEWPRFEDGAKVRFGDSVRLGECMGDAVDIDLYAIAFERDGYHLLDEDDYNDAHMSEAPADRYGVGYERPEVIAADGLPIEVGETVYNPLGEACEVVACGCEVTLCEPGCTTYGLYGPDEITHTPPDTQQRIDDDATMPPRAYYAKHIGHDVGLKDDAECTEAMVRHLLNRQREIDGRTMGGE